MPTPPILLPRPRPALLEDKPAFVKAESIAVRNHHAVPAPLEGPGLVSATGRARFAIADPDKNLAWVWVFKPATGNLKLSTAGVRSEERALCTWLAHHFWLVY